MRMRPLKVRIHINEEVDVPHQKFICRVPLRDSMTQWPAQRHVIPRATGWQPTRVADNGGVATQQSGRQP